MSNLSNIISSKLVSSEWDKLWKEFDASGRTKAAAALVITTTFAAGSAEENQLLKMMQACQLNTSDYNILQLQEGETIAWHQLRDNLDPKFVLLLGVSPQQLGISAMLRIFYPNRFNDRIFIPGLTLQESEKQPEAKKQLWQHGLKPVFVDKAYS